MTRPIRTCVACGRKAPQEDLMRFSEVGGTLAPDPARHLPGRGAYTCRSTACFESARARRAFARTLRRAVRIPDDLNPFSVEG